MHPRERRSNKPIPIDPEILAEGLNPAQRKTLSTLRESVFVAIVQARRCRSRCRG